MPLTVYVVVILGVTTKVLPVILYVAAPDGVMVKSCPAQILPLFTEMVGLGFTVTLITAGERLTQPKVLVPLTEYELVALGVITALPDE